MDEVKGSERKRWNEIREVGEKKRSGKTLLSELWDTLCVMMIPNTESSVR